MQGDHRPFGSEPEQSLTVWKIALGVCIGSLVASAITWTVAETRLRWEVEQAATALKLEAAKSQRAMAQAQQDAAFATQRAARQQEQLDAEQRQRLAEQQRVEGDARRGVQDEVNRKEAAWKRFYKPTPACAAESLSVECANAHIRAKRAFEAKFTAGEL